MAYPLVEIQIMVQYIGSVGVGIAVRFFKPVAPCIDAGDIVGFLAAERAHRCFGVFQTDGGAVIFPFPVHPDTVAVPFLGLAFPFGCFLGGCALGKSRRGERQCCRTGQQ